MEKVIEVSPMPDVAPVLLLDKGSAAQYLGKGTVDWPDMGAAAVTFHQGDRWFIAIDALRLLDEGIDLENLLAVLAHECLHAALGHLAVTIGDDEPSNEELAYHVQAVFYSTVVQLFEWLERQ